MKKFVILGLLVLAAPIWAVNISFEDNTVAVTSEASVYTLPEAATIDFFIKVTSASPEDITARAMDAAEELYRDLIRLGVSEPLEQSSSMDIYTDVDWNTQRPSYQLTLTLRCLVADLDDLDGIIEKITEQDFSSSDVSSTLSMITYSVSDIEVYREKLIASALESAKQKAESAARELGRSIGDMVYLDTSEPLTDYMWYPYYPWQFTSEDMGQGNAPRIMIGLSVTATYELTE